MDEQLVELSDAKQILETGTGSGYQSAILSRTISVRLSTSVTKRNDYWFVAEARPVTPGTRTRERPGRNSSPC